MILPSKKERDAFKQYMNDNGVMVNQVHKRNDEYTVFKPFARKGLDGVDYFADRMICIPVHWGLSIEELDQIAGMCNKFAQKQGSKK